MLAKQEKGLRYFHGANPNQWRKNWQVRVKNWLKTLLCVFFGNFIAILWLLLNAHCAGFFFVLSASVAVLLKQPGPRLALGLKGADKNSRIDTCVIKTDIPV